MKHRLDSDLLFDQNSRRKRAHTRLRASAVRYVHTVNAGFLEKANRVERLLRVDAFRRQHFNRSYKLSERDLPTPLRTFFGWRDANMRSRNLDCDRRTRAKGNALRTWRSSAHRVGDQLDVCRSRAAAAANELRTRLDESFRKLRHVLGRAHVKLPSLYVARQTRVWLCRQFLLRDLAHLFQRRENDCWSNSAVQSDNVCAPLVESFGKQLRRGAKQRVAIGHDRHLRDDRQIAELTHRGYRLPDLRNVGKSLEAEKIDAAFQQSFSLRLEHLLRFVKRRWAIRLDAQAEWSNRAGDVRTFARGLTRDPGGEGVDLSQTAFESVLLKLMGRGAERVGLDDVRTGANVFGVNLTHEIRIGEIQLVVTAIDIDAFGVEHRTHCAVDDYDTISGEKFLEWLHL